MSVPYVNAGLVGTSSEWIAEHIQKLVDYLLFLQRDPSMTPTVLRKLITSCNLRERNLKELNLEISEVMSLVHCAIFTYLESHCSGIREHSDGNVPELRRTGTMFNGEYLEAHPQAFQIILPFETFHKSLLSEEKTSDMAQ